MAQIASYLALLGIAIGVSIAFLRSKAGIMSSDNEKIKQQVAEDDKKVDVNNILLTSEEDKRKELEDKIKDTKNVSNSDLEDFFKQYKKKTDDSSN